MKLKQLEPVVETVGDYKFYITPFPALKAANMTGELASTAKRKRTGLWILMLVKLRLP